VELCDFQFTGWKQLLAETLAKKPGLDVELDDELLPIAPIIMHRLGQRRDVHSALVTLVRNIPPDDVFAWVDALNFPKDWGIEREAIKLVRRFEFLRKYKADWILEYV